MADGDQWGVLRRRAEEILRSSSENRVAIAERTAKELLHELRTHEVELELQNEDLRRALHELEVSRERYRRLYDDAPVGYLTADHRSRILQANTTAREMLGEDALEGGDLLTFVDPRDQQRLAEELEKDDEEAVSALRIRHNTRDGVGRILAVESRSTRSDDGDLLHNLVLTDVTEQENLTEQLRRSERRLREAHALARLGSFEVRFDGEKSLIELCYDALLLLGRPAHSLSLPLHRFVFEIVDPADQLRVSQELSRIQEERAESWDFGFRIRCPDRSVRHVQSTGRTSTDHTGAVTRALGTLLDVTPQRTAELAMREQRAMLQAVVDTVIDGLVTFDGTGVVQLVNPAACEMFGYTGDELQRTDVFRLLAEPYGALFAEQLEQFETGTEVEFTDGMVRELIGLRSDGTSFPLEMGVGYFSEGRPFFAAVFRDMSERTRMESELRQAQKLEAVGSLAGGIAHDFNNLLMGIIGCCQMAVSALDEGSAALPYIEEVRSAAKRGSQVTRRLLDFSRKRALDPRPIALNEILDASEPLLRRILGEDVELKVSLCQGGDTILADSGQAEQIVMNLVVNARDALPDGGLLVMETKSVARSGHPGVLLTVRDTGTGMDEETLSRVFEPFYTTKEEGRGTGLGLATVYGIVQQLRGVIEVESEVGSGTTFRIWLPQYVSESNDERSAERVSTDALGAGRSVLLVEDEPLVRLTVRNYLEEMGLRVLEASDANAAVELYDETPGPIDLVITDVVLPEGSGRSLAEHILASNPEVRVLFMSAYPEALLHERGRIPEGATVLQKPFDPQTLAMRLHELLWLPEDEPGDA